MGEHRWNLDEYYNEMGIGHKHKQNHREIAMEGMNINMNITAYKKRELSVAKDHGAQHLRQSGQCYDRYFQGKSW